MTKIGTISGQKNKNMENYYASFLKNKKSKKNKGNLADKNGEKNMGKNMDNNVGNVGSVSNQMGVMKVNFDSILKGDVCKESEVDNSFPIMRNKILFDFLVKPYLNIKTMATLANVSTAFREWSVVDNNKWWFKYYYVLNIEGKNYHAKKRNIQMWEIDQKFEKYSKKYQATFVPTMSYYHRLVFCGVFAIKDNMFNITKDMMTDQRNMIKVTLTQKDQLTLLFPEKPSHILTAIANCDVLVEKAEKEVERLKRVLVFMQLCVDIRLNIRLFEKTYLGSISPL